jgi:hypothetical protein
MAGEQHGMCELTRQGNGMGAAWHVWISLKVVANSLPKFGIFCWLQSDITRRSAMLQGPWRSGFLCGARMDPLLILNTSKNPNYMSTHITCAFVPVPDTAHFCYPMHWSQLWVEYQHWTKKRSLFVDQKGFQWHILRIQFRQINNKKSGLSTKIDIYSDRRAHRRATFRVGVLCRGCGALTCNTQPSVY